MMAKCSYCPARYQITRHDLGKSFLCKSCKNHFTVVPCAEDKKGSSHEEAAATNHATALPLKPERGPASDIETPVAAADALDSTGPAFGDGASAGGAKAWGASAFFLGGLGFLFAALGILESLTLILGVAGCLVAAAGFVVCAPSKAGEKLWLGVGGFVSVVFLAVALFWPEWFGWYRTGRVVPPDFSRPMIVSPGEAPQPLPDDAPWLEMGKGALRLENVQVQVMRGSWLRKAEVNVVRLEVRFSNVSADRRLEFGGWSAREPRLHDAAGKPLKFRAAAVGKKEKAASSAVSVPPGKNAEEALEFAAPRPMADYYLLELPNSAWGGQGSLKFKVTREFLSKGMPIQ